MAAYADMAADGYKRISTPDRTNKYDNAYVYLLFVAISLNSYLYQ